MVSIWRHFRAEIHLQESSSHGLSNSQAPFFFLRQSGTRGTEILVATEEQGYCFGTIDDDAGHSIQRCTPTAKTRRAVPLCELEEICYLVLDPVGFPVRPHVHMAEEKPRVPA